MNKKKVAIMYDFDRTLSSKDMQEFSFIPSLGYKKTSDFWNESAKLAKENKMDRILAYLYLMLRKSQEANVPIHKENFEKLGKSVELYPGVETWFKRVNEKGKELNLEIEHYIISSGLKEIIDGTSIVNEFKKVYACRFLYDANDVAVWPSLVVNYTTKTQYIFRINKQILAEDADDALNEYYDDNNRPIPFNRMIYIGDGLTDVPCMKLLKEKGGKSIVVYDKDKSVAKSLIKSDRVNYMMKADYREDTEMEKLIFAVFENIKSVITLEEMDVKNNER
ncbi:MAG: HAD family hydrolase [Anaerorhabdus sp.]